MTTCKGQRVTFFCGLVPSIKKNLEISGSQKSEFWWSKYIFPACQPLGRKSVWNSFFVNTQNLIIFASILFWCYKFDLTVVVRFQDLECTFRIFADIVLVDFANFPTNPNATICKLSPRNQFFHCPIVIIKSYTPRLLCFIIECQLNYRPEKIESFQSFRSIIIV